MYDYPTIGNVLIPDPRKSAGKHALCVTVPKEFPSWQNRYAYPAGFYVKGNIRGYYFKMVRLVKREDGSFLFPVPTDIRRKLKLKAGDGINLDIRKDRLYHGMHDDLMMVLFKEPQESLRFYSSLRHMGKHYFHQWINTAKTPEVRAHRIAQMLEALRNKQTFKQMKKR